MNVQLRTMLTVGMVLALTSCEEAPPTSPSNETATFTAQLSPAGETPPVTGVEATGTGAVTITFSIYRDTGGAIVSALAAFQATLSSFPAGTKLTMAHIHRGIAGVPGPIVVDTGLTNGQVVLTTGSGSFNKNSIPVSPSIAQEIIDAPEAFYFNVHSVINPNGMVRGQLVRQ